MSPQPGGTRHRPRGVDTGGVTTARTVSGHYIERELLFAVPAQSMVENVIWPAYLDVNLTRSEGRRVPAELAVDEPTVEEIARAVKQVGYGVAVEREKTYPREHEPRGRVLVGDAGDASKSDLLQATAAYLGAIRT